jgi:hypothetical protein
MTAAFALYIGGSSIYIACSKNGQVKMIPNEIDDYPILFQTIFRDFRHCNSHSHSHSHGDDDNDYIGTLIMIFARVHRNIIKQLNLSLSKAQEIRKVLIIPQYFNDDQRRTMRDTAMGAGFLDSRMIGHQTSALVWLFLFILVTTKAIIKF